VPDSVLARVTGWIDPKSLMTTSQAPTSGGRFRPQKESRSMALTTTLAATDRSRSTAAHPIALRLAAVAGIIGLVLRLVSADTFSPSQTLVSGYPESGIGPAVAETLGVALLVLTFVAAYRVLADRRVAKLAAGIAVAAGLVLATAGLDLAFDGALIGALLLAAGLGIGVRSQGSVVGWLGVVAGSLVLATALPSSAFEPSRQAREAAQIAALATGFFILAVSVALWRRADALSAYPEGADR
jgi:hypothetical protein